ncbi:Bacterial regulatory proteins, luxR family [Escherichia coli]|nr:Bacterial regulatory proteins, luxR family [Escherichia coli]SQY98219.1 Bacterial regulatory proteins, luxR family [Escherichia coli]
MVCKNFPATFERYIWAPCYYAREGVDIILQDVEQNICTENMNSCAPSTGFDKHVQIIIFLYGGVSSVLTGIRRLVHIFNTVTFDDNWPDVLFLGELPPQWLFETLSHQLPRPALDYLRFVNSKVFFRDLKSHKCNFSMSNFPLLKHLKDSLFQSPVKIQSGLTSREFDVLYGYYNGLSINVMAGLYRLSEKTIYSYRRNAIKKIKLMKDQLKTYRGVFLTNL